MQKRYVIRQNMIAIIGICISVYFCYHLIAGERSFIRLMDLEKEIVKAESDLTVMNSHKEDLETKVVMMRPGSINRDLLEERVRSVLGYRAADERVLLQTN